MFLLTVSEVSLPLPGVPNGRYALAVQSLNVSRTQFVNRPALLLPVLGESPYALPLLLPQVTSPLVIFLKTQLLKRKVHGCIASGLDFR